MIVRRTLEGALKWALRDFLREEDVAGNISISRVHMFEGISLTGIDLGHRGDDVVTACWSLC